MIQTHVSALLVLLVLISLVRPWKLCSLASFTDELVCHVAVGVWVSTREHCCKLLFAIRNWLLSSFLKHEKSSSVSSYVHHPYLQLVFVSYLFTVWCVVGRRGRGGAGGSPTHTRTGRSTTAVKGHVGEQSAFRRQHQSPRRGASHTGQKDGRRLQSNRHLRPADRQNWMTMNHHRHKRYYTRTGGWLVQPGLAVERARYHFIFSFSTALINTCSCRSAALRSISFVAAASSDLLVATCTASQVPFLVSEVATYGRWARNS